MSSEEEELSGLVIKKRKGKEISQGVIELSTSSMSKTPFFDFLILSELASRHGTIACNFYNQIRKKKTQCS